jgi:phospholipid transport system substrate-binding protein
MKAATRYALVISFALALVAPPRHAQGAAPDALVKTVTREVLALIRQAQDSGSASAKQIEALVEAKVVPHFDLERMTRLAMGRNWRRASHEQRDALVAQFKSLLVRTYSASLANYSDQTIEFKPLRAQPGDTEVTVRSEIRQSGARAITIDYELAKEAANGWKVFNITIEGVSLVLTYRDTFAALAREGGVDAVIKELAAKNEPSRAASD